MGFRRRPGYQGQNIYEKMRQENPLRISNLRLFLVIIAILLSICKRSLFAYAQEADVSDIWQNAALLIPNGDPIRNTFSFYMDMDWYKFYAEYGVTYNISTRNEKNPVKEYNLLDILIYVYSDPTRDYYIAHDMDIENDGNALIEWFCPDSGTYFVMVQALNPFIFGNREAYTIQITGKKYPQDAYKIIPDVPDYSQSDFGNRWDCKAVAAACILGYWSAHGYDLLVDSNPERMEDVARLVYELHEAMVDSVQRSPEKIFTDENVREGIEFFCNTPRYGNNYDFKIEYDAPPDFLKITEEINNKMPVLFGVVGHPLWGNHWIATVGYLKTDNNEWIINHDNWSTTHRDIYLDLDETADSIITIHPPSPPPPPPPEEDPDPLPGDFHPVNQYTPYSTVSPWPTPFPAFGYGMISPFAGINKALVPSWSYPAINKYSSQFYSGGNQGLTWPSNQGLYNDKRSSMAGGTKSVFFSPNNYYTNSNFYNINGYNNAARYGDIISNPFQKTYFGINPGPYPFSAQGSNDLYSYPSFSFPQMSIPSLKITSSPGTFPFPFPSLSPFLSSLGLSFRPFL